MNKNEKYFLWFVISFFQLYHKKKYKWNTLRIKIRQAVLRLVLSRSTAPVLLYARRPGGRTEGALLLKGEIFPLFVFTCVFKYAVVNYQKLFNSKCITQPLISPEKST